MDNTYFNASEALEEAKKYHEEELVIGDKSYTIGIRYGLSLSESMEFIEAVKNASLDDNGNFDEELNYFAKIVFATKYYTNINPDAEYEDIVLLWESSNLSSLMTSETSYPRLSLVDSWNPVENTEREKFFSRINKLLDALSGEEDVDEDTQNKILGNLANADWKEIVNNVLDSKNNSLVEVE